MECNKRIKYIILTVATVIAIAAAVAAILIYKEEIAELLGKTRAKITEKKNAVFNSDEFSDYADV